MDREKEIGKRIREIRELKGMTLEILARKTKFTKGYLSRLENSKKAPPVATLLSIARALDVRIADIFGETEEHTSLSIVRKNDRLMMARSGTIFGYHYESLVHKFKNKSMDAFILTRPHDPKWKPVVFKHEGEELLFVLEGSQEFFYGGESFILKKGDCAYFDASVEHYGRSIGGRPSKMLMVTTLPANHKEESDEEYLAE